MSFVVNKYKTLIMFFRMLVIKFRDKPLKGEEVNGNNSAQSCHWRCKDNQRSSDPTNYCTCSRIFINAKHQYTGNYCQGNRQSIIDIHCTPKKAGFNLIFIITMGTVFVHFKELKVVSRLRIYFATSAAWTFTAYDSL
jgi:hypothetical protein